MSIEKMIKGHDLFRSLSVDEVHLIGRFSSVKDFRAKDLVYDYNAPCSHVYMLMDGTVHLQLPANPPEFSFAISKVEKGELFGISSLLEAPRYPSSAKCATDAQVLSIEAKPFRELLQKNASVGFTIINQVARIYLGRYIELLRRLQDVVSQISLIR